MAISLDMSKPMQTIGDDYRHAVAALPIHQLTMTMEVQESFLISPLFFIK
jgi:hypothetical protein